MIKENKPLEGNKNKLVDYYYVLIIFFKIMFDNFILKQQLYLQMEGKKNLEELKKRLRVVRY